MSEKYKLEDIKSDGFIHSRVYEFVFDPEEKTVKINVGFADLKKGGAIVDCTIAITGWWDFEVLHYREKEVINIFKNNDIPELDGIIDFSYDGNTLILEDLCGINEYYHFKFIRPEIKITGEYDPD